MNIKEFKRVEFNIFCNTKGGIIMTNTFICEEYSFIIDEQRSYSSDALLSFNGTNIEDIDTNGLVELIKQLIFAVSYCETIGNAVEELETFTNNFIQHMPDEEAEIIVRLINETIEQARRDAELIVRDWK